MKNEVKKKMRTCEGVKAVLKSQTRSECKKKIFVNANWKPVSILHERKARATLTHLSRNFQFSSSRSLLPLSACGLYNRELEF